MWFYLRKNISTLSNTHTDTHTLMHKTSLLLRCYKNIFFFFYPLKIYRSCALPSLLDVFSVLMESLPSHFFSLFFIWSNYRYFFPLSFLLSTYLPSPLCSFRGALTTAFLLGTCLKGSRSMWCPLTIHYGCFLLALTSQATKDSFSTGTNFSF